MVQVIVEATMIRFVVAENAAVGLEQLAYFLAESNHKLECMRKVLSKGSSSTVHSLLPVNARCDG